MTHLRAFVETSALILATIVAVAAAAMGIVALAMAGAPT
jgi:hypothetical protein